MNRTYALEMTRRAERALRGLGEDIQDEVRAAIRQLAAAPRPPGCKKVRGPGSLYRIRVRDYRVIYRVEDVRLLVIIIEIGHRREIYRRGLKGG